MDKNQVIGFVLIFVILMAWGILQKPPVVEDAGLITNTLNDTTSVLEEPSLEATATDSLPALQRELIQRRFGEFAQYAAGTEETVRLENDLVAIDFSNKGGRIKKITLKKHFLSLKRGEDSKDRENVVLFANDNNKFNYELSLIDQTVNTQDLYFSSSVKGNSVEFTIQNTEGAYFLQRYELQRGSYKVDYDIRFYGLNDLLANKPVPLSIVNHLEAIEENVQFEKRYSTIYYKAEGEDSDYCSCTSSDEDNRENQKIQWISFAHQFFNVSLIADQLPFDGMIAGNEMTPEDNKEELKRSYATLQVPFSNGFDERFGMEMYLGPNEYKRLSAYDIDLQEIIPFGRSIFGDINRIFIRPFFDWLSQYIGSKGLVIIVLIFIVKMAFYPLTYKMLHSQAKMGALKPELAKLKERLKDDAQQQQVETMKIYREYGVSPFGGCLPMVVQMPIWYALFRFFPASITFRQEPFLWAKDLSSYDVLFYLPFEIPMMGGHLSLFTVLWAVTTVIYTFYNMRHMDMAANPAMKYVQYLMPLMFFVFFNNYASGLTCYMFFSNLINIGQTVITKNFIFDEEKIRAELNIQKAKPKKKNTFQSRLEDAMKQQQRVQQEKKKTKKK